MSKIRGHEWFDVYRHDLLKHTSAPLGFVVFPVSAEVDAKAFAEAMKAIESELRWPET